MTVYKHNVPTKVLPCTFKIWLLGINQVLLNLYHTIRPKQLQINSTTTAGYSYKVAFFTHTVQMWHKFDIHC